LFTKEFSVSTAPEVGRIIDVQDLPSSLDLVFLSKDSKTGKTVYISHRGGLIEQYIAQRQTVKHHSAFCFSL
jgi:inner membrane transporter RhtA